MGYQELQNHISINNTLRHGNKHQATRHYFGHLYMIYD